MHFTTKLCGTIHYIPVRNIFLIGIIISQIEGKQAQILAFKNAPQ